MPVEKEFTVNDYLSLKAENNDIYLYVKEKRFLRCEFLLLQVDEGYLTYPSEIKSIDDVIKGYGFTSIVDVISEYGYHLDIFEKQEEVGQKLETISIDVLNDIPIHMLEYLISREDREEISKHYCDDIIDFLLDLPFHILIGGKYLPELVDLESRFWGFCSNLQAWYEHKYDTRLLHSEISFPLLKKLSEEGDPMAKSILKNEIIKRHDLNIFLMFNEYIDLLTKEELILLFEKHLNNLKIVREPTPIGQMYDKLNKQALTIINNNKQEYLNAFLEKRYFNLNLEELFELIGPPMIEPILELLREPIPWAGLITHTRKEENYNTRSFLNEYQDISPESETLEIWRRYEDFIEEKCSGGHTLWGREKKLFLKQKLRITRNCLLPPVPPDKEESEQAVKKVIYNFAKKVRCNYVIHDLYEDDYIESFKVKDQAFWEAVHNFLREDFWKLIEKGDIVRDLLGIHELSRCYNPSYIEYTFREMRQSFGPNGTRILIKDNKVTQLYLEFSEWDWRPARGGGWKCRRNIEIGDKSKQKIRDLIPQLTNLNDYNIDGLDPSWIKATYKIIEEQANLKPTKICAHCNKRIDLDSRICKFCGTINKDFDQVYVDPGYIPP